MASSAWRTACWKRPAPNDSVARCACSSAVLVGTMRVIGAAAGLAAGLAAREPRTLGTSPGRSGAPSLAQNFALGRFTRPQRGQTIPAASAARAEDDCGAGWGAGCAAADWADAAGAAGVAEATGAARTGAESAGDAAEMAARIALTWAEDGSACIA